MIRVSLSTATATGPEEDVITARIRKWKLLPGGNENHICQKGRYDSRTV